MFAEVRGADAVIQLDDVLFTTHRKQITDLAVKHHLPAIYGFKEFVDVGGLSRRRRAAVDRETLITDGW